jgi:hypothetical protein
VQVALAGWLIVNDLPPTAIVPVREIGVVLGETLNATVPLSDPLAVPVMVIQLALLTAVQLHPGDVATVNDPVPPDEATD